MTNEKVRARESLLRLIANEYRAPHAGYHVSFNPQEKLIDATITTVAERIAAQHCKDKAEMNIRNEIAMDLLSLIPNP